MNPRLSALAALALLACAKSEAELPVQINEILASNQTGATDEAGEREDWVELYNAGAEPIVLDGWSIGADKERRQPLADGLQIDPGGHLLLWADDDSAAGPFHLGFRLAVEGESVVLFAPGAVEVDRLAWGPLIPDHSLARVGDGAADWEVRPNPSPGATNGAPPADLPLGDPDCGPQITLATPFPVEGDAVQLSASCASSGQAEWAWFGPTFGTEAALSWATDLGHAGQHQVLLSAKAPGLAGVPQTAVIELGVADDWTHPDNQPVDPLSYTREWGLPVLHLDADPALIGQEYSSTIGWFDGVRYSAQIKIRGAASAGYPKNNFTVEFDPEQLALGDYGLSNKDHLVLLSNFDDNSHLRQRLVYDTWAAMADHAGAARLTPRSTPVVLYLNGAYHGLYLALDHVDDEFLREMGLESGSNLYKSVSHDANFYLTNAAGSPKATFHDGWEKKEGEPPYDFSDLDALTQGVGSIDHDGFAAEADTWLVTDEFIDWFHLVFALAADDSAGKNAYLYADPADGRFRYVPWDFNHAVGQTWQTARQPAEGLNFYVWNNAIFWHLQEHPGLSATHWARFDALRAPGAPLHLDSLLTQLEAYDAELGAHPDRDWERWGDEYQVYGLWSWRTDWTTPTEERAYLDTWLTARSAALP